MTDVQNIELEHITLLRDKLKELDKDWLKKMVAEITQYIPNATDQLVYNIVSNVRSHQSDRRAFMKAGLKLVENIANENKAIIDKVSPAMAEQK